MAEAAWEIQCSFYTQAAGLLIVIPPCCLYLLALSEFDEEAHSISPGGDNE